MSRIDSFSGEHRFLSNFWYSEVAFANMLYPTNEHAFQAAKTNSQMERYEILTAESPGKAKLLGRSVTLRDDWEFIKLHVMLNLNRQKFQFNNDLKAKLLATGDAELIEGNHWGDKYWGVCAGEGTNYLGRILMCVRGELVRKE